MNIFLKLYAVILFVGFCHIAYSMEGSDPVDRSPSRWEKLKEAVRAKRLQNTGKGTVNDPFATPPKNDTEKNTKQTQPDATASGDPFA